MYSNIPSVSKAIKDILFSNSIYLNSLKLGIANYTALAIKIKPEVDRTIGSEITINTIVVSIKRIADALQQNLQQNLDLESIAQKEKENLAGARISLTGSILDVEFDKEIENIEKVLELFDRQSDIRFNIFQSKNHMNLFIENISEIKKIFSKDSQPIIPSKIKEGVSMITISLPWEETELRKTYQLLSIISNILYDNQISLHNAFFTLNEIVLIK